jgi:SAM-dependent methyltransferase
MLAIEPSATMRSQRPERLEPAIAAGAEALPLDDGSVDAVMAILTVHHWEDAVAGLRELRRVARDRVVAVTFDIDVLARYWLLTDYLPEAWESDRERFPALAEICEALGGASVEQVPVPADCTGGFFEAYYARLAALLDPNVRAAQSAWPRLPPELDPSELRRGSLWAVTERRIGLVPDRPDHRRTRGVVARSRVAHQRGPRGARRGRKRSCVRNCGDKATNPSPPRRRGHQRFFWPARSEPYGPRWSANPPTSSVLTLSTRRATSQTARAVASIPSRPRTRA